MPSLSKIKEITLVALQNYPEIAARYAAGDPTIVAPIHAMQHLLAETSRDVDISELEPFVKSREATILADASNKGILPLATPCQHHITVKNGGTEPVALQSNRVILDGQGRAWRLLQHADIAPGETAQILAEQSEVRTVEYLATSSEPFFQYRLDLQDELSLYRLNVRDQDDNVYSFVPRWMNTQANEQAIVLKTNSKREIILEFGDSQRFGQTLEVNTRLSIEIIETYGELDVTALREASLENILNAQETKLTITFTPAGLVRLGADPLSIDQLALLASYPTHDDNAVFLGNFDFLVRKNFMARTHYCNVWNEAIHEKYFGASVSNINHLFVCLVPRNEGELQDLQNEVRQLITKADSLYSSERTVFVHPVPRPFAIQIHGTLSPIHDRATVENQIKTLLLSTYGRGKIATSYHVSDGFNLQEITRLISRDIVAFQDRQSDFKVYTEDLAANPVKPNEWLYMDESSISFNIQRSSGLGGSLWTVL